MPDYRRAWHRGGACLFNRQPVTAWAHDLPARDIRVPRCLGSAELIHHPMKHGLTRRVVDSPYSSLRRLVAEGVYPEGRAGRNAATCGHAAQYASLLRPTWRRARAVSGVFSSEERMI